MAFWLSLHVRYACRHAGACCSSGWPVPLERERDQAVARAVTTRQIRVRSPWLWPVADRATDVAGVLAQRRGRCVFRQHERCAIHAQIGHEALPIACQHFPRVCLIDDRGVFVTLSHYCPTAAGMLLSDEGPIRIVEGPEPVPGAAPEGLDARGAWPPLLAPGVLMDLESYSLWESHVVDWLGGVRNPRGEWAPHEVLSLLTAQARRVASWRPGGRSLPDAIRDLGRDSPSRDEQHATWRAHIVAVNRLLAAHAFASWTAYQADGVVAQVQRLHGVLETLHVEADRVCRRDDRPLTESRLLEAIRQTDLRLRHRGGGIVWN